MPRERIEFFRVSNEIPKEKIIVLAYEGNHTEAIYFESFKDSDIFNEDKIYLVSLRRRKDNTESAPIHVFKKLKKEAKDEYNFDLDDELWMVIDRDNWNNIKEIHELCVKEKNFHLALSNPCFELWLLLHIKDLKEYSEEELTKIFENKKVSKKKTHLKALLSELLGGYQENNPRPERFLPHINLAIARAIELDIDNEDFPSKMGTHIYKLAQRLIK